MHMLEISLESACISVMFTFLTIHTQPPQCKERR